MGRSAKDRTPNAYEFAVARRKLRLADVDLSRSADDKDAADREIGRLQKELFALQVRLFQKRAAAVFVFEGWDAAGKGGAIKRLTALMDPRGFKVWPVSAPREHELARHYLWRFSTKLPEQGEIAVFDRSWYGRVLVERVEGFATEAQWRRAYDEINAFEQTLTADGVAMAKFWLHIDQKTQLKRFEEREAEPLKRYKIGPDDWRNRKKWSKYETAAQEMFDRTNRSDAPWHLIAANDKRSARIQVLQTCARTLSNALK